MDTYRHVCVCTCVIQWDTKRTLSRRVFCRSGLWIKGLVRSSSFVVHVSPFSVPCSTVFVVLGTHRPRLHTSPSQRKHLTSLVRRSFRRLGPVFRDLKRNWCRNEAGEKVLKPRTFERNPSSRSSEK